LDIWVSPDAENAERVYKSLREFGAPLTGLSPSDFSMRGFFYTMGIAPSRIDIIFDLTDLDFDECWERRIDTDLGGTATHIISIRDIIRNKKASGRFQDLADVEKLEITLERGVNSIRTERERNDIEE